MCKGGVIGDGNISRGKKKWLIVRAGGGVFYSLVEVEPRPNKDEVEMRLTAHPNKSAARRLVRAAACLWADAFPYFKLDMA
jgi:hypothetical protein